MKPLHSIFVIILLSLACHIVSCSNSKLQETFNHAEFLMETRADSALKLLSDIDKTSLSGKAEKARYALLMSMALDKNLIDTTNFDVLQPAIDYYLDNGTPDEKLRTYYYQERIFQNAGDRDNALNSFIKGSDIAPLSHDSLCVARLLVAEGIIYKEFYDFNGYASNYLKAATIYKDKALKELEFDCLMNALNGVIIIHDFHRADSILSLCSHFSSLDNDQDKAIEGYRLSYTLNFKSVQELKNMIDTHSRSWNLDINGILNLALAYNRIGENETAQQLLTQVKQQGAEYDTIKYQYINVAILENLGKYEEAYRTYRDFVHRWDAINAFKFDQKAKSLNEKHKIELQAQKDARHKSQIIWSCVGGIVVLAMGVVILLLLVRSNRTKKALALEKVKAKESENAKLKSESEKLVLEKDRLALENKTLQLEMDNKVLEAENLAHRVATLETESDSLRALIDAKEELPGEVKDAIKVRIEMLNSLLASYITDNDQYEKPYDTWVRELTDDTEAFMNSNRLAFQASHPNFIRYFEDHGLTTEEINYVCLYAIGLRGKEVGSYMKKRSHVNTSSAIRKKLGIDKHETNIGIYVRKLLKSL